MKQLFVLIGFVLCLSGCFTTGGNQTMFNHINARMGHLEGKIAQRDNEIRMLKDELRLLAEDMRNLERREEMRPKVIHDDSAKGSVQTISDEGLIRVGVSPREIQQALTQAGFYDGPLDNKLGDKTLAAVMAFQKDQGLSADGVVGAKTWQKLKEFSQ